MNLQTLDHLATIVGLPIAIIVPLAIASAPWAKKKLKVWWDKIRKRTEFTLGCKTKFVGSETSSPKYEIGYLCISYETNHRKRFIDWRFRILDSVYKRIGELPNLGNIANERYQNNIIEFERKRRKSVVESADSYIYQNTNVLAFYSIKQFDQVPNWADSPYIERQTRTYFKNYEILRQNQRDLQNGIKWVKYEDIEEHEGLFITYMNKNHNRDPLIPESKKIKKLLKKGFKKQFAKNKIGDIVCLKRRTEH